MSGPKRVLLFRIGQLGDTMVALPAIRSLRSHFASARLTLLCDRQVGRSYVLASELFEGTGLIDDYITYPFDASSGGRLLRPLRMGFLLARLRSRRFDTVVYLAPSMREILRIERDRRFFAMSGIRTFVGFDGFRPSPIQTGRRPIARGLQEADLLLERLAASGIPVPPAGRGVMDLGLGDREEMEVRRWLGRREGGNGKPWVGFGPGSNLPVNRWPLERYEEVGRGLIDSHDIWPVVFGGGEDRGTAERLIMAWRRGYSAAGQLSPRASASALARCRLYLGQDSGPIHLAAAAGTRCVGIYSSRDYPGAWYPYGEGHRVLRTDIDCEGCLLVECLERRMECILSIRADVVLSECRKILNTSVPRSRS